MMIEQLIRHAHCVLVLLRVATTGPRAGGLRAIVVAVRRK